MNRIVPFVFVLLSVVILACGNDDGGGSGTSDEDVLSRVTDALQAKNGWDPESVEVTLESVVDERYAFGGVRDVGAGGGGLWFAALVNGDWTIVWDGNGAIDCPSLDPYPDFPPSLISECYNPSDGSLTDRTSGDSAAPTKPAGELTVQGNVADVALSAKVIMLQPPISGISSIAITEDTTITFADGRQAQLRDVERGDTIEATGTAGSPGSLLAREVVIQ